MVSLKTLKLLQRINSFGWNTDHSSSNTTRNYIAILTFQSLSEIFIRRSWYSVLQTMSCRVIKVDSCFRTYPQGRSTSHESRRRQLSIPSHAYVLYDIVTNDIIIITRNTFCGTWYLPHRRVHKSIAELCSNFGDSAISKGQMAYFPLRMREKRPNIYFRSKI